MQSKDLSWMSDVLADLAKYCEKNDLTAPREAIQDALVKINAASDAKSLHESELVVRFSH